MTQVQTKPRITKKAATSAKRGPSIAAPPTQPAPQKSKLDHLAGLLARDDGASLAEMIEATGWQAHSVRGALAGALKIKRGLVIVSAKIDGVRRYSLQQADA